MAQNKPLVPFPVLRLRWQQTQVYQQKRPPPGAASQFFMGA